MCTSFFQWLVITSLTIGLSQNILHAQLSPGKITQIDQIIEEHIKEKNFTGTVLIAEAGKPIIHRSYGMAQLGDSNKIDDNFHYSIASITKLFTSLRILQLVQSEQLQLDQNLAELLPDFSIPNAGKITLHHLLLHLSGLPNEKDKYYLDPYAPEQFVQVNLSHQKAEAPGSFNYNNIDYMLLGLVIEQITQESWEENISKHLLAPLDMKHTGFLSKNKYPDDFAYPFSYSKKGKPKADPLFYIENFYAAGNMYSTAADLLKLDQALYNDVLINQDMYKLLSESYPEYNYTGYSVWNYKYPFLDPAPTLMERRGGIMGANVVLIRMPDTNHTIIILSNNNRFNPDSFGDPENLREALIRVIGKS
jgi:CubicO group peptidase (beta-lactamase class C family)